MGRSQRLKLHRRKAKHFETRLDEAQDLSAVLRKPTQQSHGLEALIDEYEYSRITGRSLASTRRDRLLGQGCPYVKLMGLVRYRPSDIRKFLENNLHGGDCQEAR